MVDATRHPLPFAVLLFSAALLVLLTAAARAGVIAAHLVTPDRLLMSLITGEIEYQTLPPLPLLQSVPHLLPGQPGPRRSSPPVPDGYG